jgi:hypothetical protein
MEEGKESTNLNTNTNINIDTNENTKEIYTKSKSENREHICNKKYKNVKRIYF